MFVADPLLGREYVSGSVPVALYSAAAAALMATQCTTYAPLGSAPPVADGVTVGVGVVPRPDPVPAPKR